MTDKKVDGRKKGVDERCRCQLLLIGWNSCGVDGRRGCWASRKRYVGMYVRRARAREQDGVRSDSRGGKATTSRRAKLSQSGNCNSPKRGESVRALANTCNCNMCTHHIPLRGTLGLLFTLHVVISSPRV